MAPQKARPTIAREAIADELQRQRWFLRALPRRFARIVAIDIVNWADVALGSGMPSRDAREYVRRRMLEEYGSYGSIWVSLVLFVAWKLIELWLLNRDD